MPGVSPPMQSALTAQQAAAQQAQNAIAQNNAIRQMVLDNSIEVKQQIWSQTYNSPLPAQIRVPFYPVGAVKYFIVECSATFSKIGGGDTATATEFNIANLLSNITIYDLDNYQRINCYGWYMEMLGTMKEQFPSGAALVLSAFDTPIKYGNNYSVLNLTAPTNLATGSCRMYYVVPCAYGARDLRGTIYAGVVNATAFLVLTPNTTPFVASTGDATLAIFTGTEATPTTISALTVTVYQVYLDQLMKYASGPAAGSPILPPLDIATQYRLNTTALTGVVAANDFPVPFTNFQQFLSLALIYDQNGTLNAGTDINNFALRAANTYVPFLIDPITQAWLTRHKIKTDWPSGVYNFDSRAQPINTNQTGNMQLTLNAITAAAGTTVYAGFEAFALTSSVLGAASLPAG